MAVAQLARRSWDTVARVDGRAIGLALGPKRRRRIQGAVSDRGYPAILATRLPKAVHVLDRFPMVQWLNAALNRLRRQLFSGAPRDALGRTFKVKKWLLLSAREELEHQDKQLLTRLMEQNQPRFEADLLQEQLRGILRHPWQRFGVMRVRLQEWILAVFDTKLEALVRVAHRIAAHLDVVRDGSQHGMPLGLVEAINGKIAALRHQARGNRDLGHGDCVARPGCSSACLMTRLRCSPLARLVAAPHLALSAGAS